MRAALDIQPLFAFTFVPGVVTLVVVCRRANLCSPRSRLFITIGRIATGVLL